VSRVLDISGQKAKARFELRCQGTRAQFRKGVVVVVDVAETRSSRGSLQTCTVPHRLRQLATRFPFQPPPSAQLYPLCALYDGEQHSLTARDPRLPPFCQSTNCRRRLIRDFKRLSTDPPGGISGSPCPDNIMLWNAVIFGPGACVVKVISPSIS
jgi:hypothetical protein